MLLNSLQSSPSQRNDWRVCHYAVAYGLAEFIDELQKSGFNLDVVSDHGQCALHFVTRETSLDIVECLLDNGLNPSHCDDFGKNALHTILARERKIFSNNGLKVFERLVTASSVSQKDNMDKTPWYYFCERTIPLALKGAYKYEKNQANLANMMIVLHESGSCAAYDQCTHRPAGWISLLVRNCLDSVAGKGVDNAKSTSEPAELSGEAVISAALHLYRASGSCKDARLSRLLVKSCIQGRLEILHKTLDVGVDVHARSEYYQGLSAMDACCFPEVDQECFLVVLDKADSKSLSDRGPDGLSPLHRLCSSSISDQQQALRKLEALLKRTLDLEVISADSIKTTAVCVAADSGFLDAVRLLDKLHANLRYINRNGWGIVSNAVLNGNISLLQYLHIRLPKSDWTRRFGIHIPIVGRVTKRYLQGCNAMHLAAHEGIAEVLEFLQATAYFPSINAETHDGFTPLHLACLSQFEGSKWLIDNGASLERTAGQCRETALHLAIRAESLENTLTLVEAGARFTEDSLGLYPEMLASPKMRANLLRVLPQCSVVIPQQVLDNLEKNIALPSTSSLYHAIRPNNLEELKRIVSSGQSLSKPDPTCGTCSPLIIALSTRNFKIVDILIRHGASTSGFACDGVSSQFSGLRSAITMAIRYPSMNSKLDALLELCLVHENHWILQDMQPLVVAAVFNPDAIDILVTHVRHHENFLSK